MCNSLSAIDIFSIHKLFEYLPRVKINTIMHCWSGFKLKNSINGHQVDSKKKPVWKSLQFKK